LIHGVGEEGAEESIWTQEEGGWRRLHNEELHNLYATQNIISDKIKMDEMSKACSLHRRDEKCIQDFGQKT